MTETWDDREAAMDAIFMRLLKREMDSAGVGQAELAGRMGGGVKQPHVSRWLNDPKVKMKANRFATALRALDADPADIMREAVAEARAAGLVEPFTRADAGDELGRRRAARAEAMADGIADADDQGIDTGAAAFGSTPDPEPQD